MAIVEQHTVGSEGLTVSAIVWRRYGRPAQGIVEKTIAMNPHLVGLPPELPTGTVLAIPIEEQSAVKDRGTVRLWG